MSHVVLRNALLRCHEHTKNIQAAWKYKTKMV